LLTGANEKLATEQQSLKRKRQASDEGNEGDNNNNSEEEKVERSESESESVNESESEETINEGEDTQGDELEGECKDEDEDDDERMNNDETIAAMAAINTKRANDDDDDDDAHLPEDPMGPATEEELQEHDLPPVRLLLLLCLFLLTSFLKHRHITHM